LLPLKNIEYHAPPFPPPQNQWGWSDDIELPPSEWWDSGEEVWEAPDLALDDGTVHVLDTEYPQHTS